MKAGDTLDTVPVHLRATLKDDKSHPGNQYLSVAEKPNLMALLCV